MVAHFQQDYFEGRVQSMVREYSAPDFELVFKAYGIEAKTICLPEEIEDWLGWL